MLSTLIDAHERRDVATADIAGAYLKAPMDDYVIMKFTGDTGKNPLRDESSAQEVWSHGRAHQSAIREASKGHLRLREIRFPVVPFVQRNASEIGFRSRTRTILALQTVTLMANNVP
jgi:hypothetical protein